MPPPARTTSPAPAALIPEDPASLCLVLYPDPVLRKRTPEIEPLDASTLARLRALAQRMLQVMRQEKGVGLAAPQLGVSVRMFVMNPTGESDDDRIYINPRLSDASGEEEREEGCLSLPEINTPVLRSLRLRMQAFDLEGSPIDDTQDGLIARIWQHETDHLDGILILDKMSATVRMSHRRKLKELEDDYLAAHPEATVPRRRTGRRK